MIDGMARKASGDRKELERLARRAVAGDLVAARRIVAILEARSQGARRRVKRHGGDDPRLIAKFQPQRWDEDDYAIDAGPVQDVDVTVAVLALDAEEVKDLRSHDDTACLVPPSMWPRGEDGTGYLDVEDELDEWLEGHGLDRTTLSQRQWEDLRRLYGVLRCDSCGRLHEFFAECEDGG